MSVTGIETRVAGEGCDKPVLVSGVRLFFDVGLG